VTEPLCHVPTPKELDDLLASISACGYASEAVEVVETWTRKWWGVESAFTTDMDATRDPMMTMTLDAAWAEVEAALPEGATVCVSSTKVASGPYIAVTDAGEPSDGYAYGPTPAAALLALAAALRDGRTK